MLLVSLGQSFGEVKRASVHQLVEYWILNFFINHQWHSSVSKVNVCVCALPGHCVPLVHRFADAHFPFFHRWCVCSWNHSSSLSHDLSELSAPNLMVSNCAMCLACQLWCCYLVQSETLRSPQIAFRCTVLFCLAILRLPLHLFSCLDGILV